MKLLFIVSHYYPYTDGVEYVVKSVAERLARRGHDVTVLCGESSLSDLKEEWINDVHVVRELLDAKNAHRDLNGPKVINQKI
ncbi:MAG: glycosyltransferase [Candidatus Bathyarchaeia archaeon]